MKPRAHVGFDLKSEYKILIWVVLVSALITLLLIIGTVAGGESEPFSAGTNDPPAQHPPLILSHNPQNRVIQMWSAPTRNPVVLYDHWDVRIYGENGTAYKLIINDIERANGTIRGYYVNISFDATRIDNANVTIQIGSMRYRWEHIGINHQLLEEAQTGGGSVGGYDDADLTRARMMGAVAVLLTSILGIPIVYLVIREYKKRKGVRQW